MTDATNNTRGKRLVFIACHLNDDENKRLLELQAILQSRRGERVAVAEIIRNGIDALARRENI